MRMFLQGLVAMEIDEGINIMQLVSMGLTWRVARRLSLTPVTRVRIRREGGRKDEKGVSLFLSSQQIQWNPLP